MSTMTRAYPLAGQFDDEFDPLDEIYEEYELWDELEDEDSFLEFEEDEWLGETNRSSRDYVRWIQSSLNKILRLRLKVDGIIGPQTKSAIRSFQRKYRLVSDGVVGPKTANALIAVLPKNGNTIPAISTSTATISSSSPVPVSSDFRARAMKLLEPLPPYPQEITSNGPQRHIFTQMTGLTQETLKAAWAKGKNLTSCNAFTGWFSRAMGSKTYLGRFDLDTFARRSWVPASSGRTPKYGDILRFKKFHVGIALDLVNGILHTAEGGQGGPKRGFDAIKRKQMPWEPNNFLGWVDLEDWIRNSGASSTKETQYETETNFEFLEEFSRGGGTSSTNSHKCLPGEGPPSAVPDPERKGLHPLVYRGVTSKRSRNPTVGDAQILLNRFLDGLANGTFNCQPGTNLTKISEIRRSLSQYPLIVDCRFGPNTEKATLMFQRCVFPNSPKQWDGKIGPDTWSKLELLRQGEPLPPTQWYTLPQAIDRAKDVLNKLPPNIWQDKYQKNRLTCIIKLFETYGSQVKDDFIDWFRGGLTSQIIDGIGYPRMSPRYFINKVTHPLRIEFLDIRRSWGDSRVAEYLMGCDQKIYQTINRINFNMQALSQMNKKNPALKQMGEYIWLMEHLPNHIYMCYLRFPFPGSAG